MNAQQFVEASSEVVSAAEAVVRAARFASLSMDSSMDGTPGVSILMSYGENPHYVKLPIFSEFMENSTKFMKNSDLTKWTQNLH